MPFDPLRPKPGVYIPGQNGPALGGPAQGPPQKPVFTPAPRRNHATAAAGPMGGATGFQTGVDANPRNQAYEDFINSIGAQQRRQRMGAGTGERIWRSTQGL